MSLNPANPQLSAAAPWPAVYVRDQANTAELEISGETGAVTPSASTFTLTSPAGVALATGPATIAPGSCTFALTSTHLPATASLGGGYIETWTLTVSGVVHRLRREVIVALCSLLMPVQLSDLTARYSTLDNQRGRAVTSWQRHLEGAWGELLRRLHNDGVYVFRALTPSALRDAHEHLTLARVFEDLASTQPMDSTHARLAREHRAAYESAYSSMRTTMDRSDLGRADAPAQTVALKPAVAWVNASPNGALRRRAW